MGSEMCIRDRYYTWHCSVLVLGCTLHDCVANGHIQNLHLLVVQRSSTVLQPSQAFHDATCECRILIVLRRSHAFHDVTCEYRILFVIFQTVAYRTRTESGSRRGVDGTRSRHQRFVSLMDCRCKGIHRRCGIYPVFIKLYAAEGKK